MFSTTFAAVLLGDGPFQDSSFLFVSLTHLLSFDMSVLCQCEICLALMLVYPYVMYVGYQPYTGTICTACPQFWSWSHQFRYLPTGSCAPWACWGSPSSLGGVQMFVVRYLHILCVVFSAISPAAVSVLHLGPLSRGCGPCVLLPCCPCCILAWAVRQFPLNINLVVVVHDDCGI